MKANRTELINKILEIFKKNWDIFIILSLSLTYFIFRSIFIRENILLSILGLILIFVVPGYFIYMLFFPRKGEQTKTEKIGFTIILSVIFISIIGYLFVLTIFDREQIVIWMIFLLILILGIICIYIRSRIENANYPTPLNNFSFGFIKNFWRKSPISTKILSILSIIMIIGMVSSLAYVLQYDFSGSKITQFYLTNEDGSPIEDPNLLLNETLGIKVTIVNYEGINTNYTLEIWSSNSSSISNLEYQYMNFSLAAKHNIYLLDGLNYTNIISLQFSQSCNWTIYFLLFKNNDPSLPDVNDFSVEDYNLLIYQNRILPILEMNTNNNIMGLWFSINVKS